MRGFDYSPVLDADGPVSVFRRALVVGDEHDRLTHLLE